MLSGGRPLSLTDLRRLSDSRTWTQQSLLDPVTWIAAIGIGVLVFSECCADVAVPQSTL